MSNIQNELLEFLMSAPAPQAVIAFHASEEAQARLQELLDRNREGRLSDDEHAELEEASQLNHFMMLLKAKAYQAVQVEEEQPTHGIRGQVVVDYFNNQSKSTAEDWEEFHRDLMEMRERSKK